MSTSDACRWMLHTDPEKVSEIVLRMVRGNERSFMISLPLPVTVTVTPAGCCRTARPGGTVTASRRAKRCDSGCCAATATYSMTAKNIAASLIRSEEHTSELQSRQYLVCRLLLEKKKNRQYSLQSRRTTYNSRRCK